MRSGTTHTIHGWAPISGILAFLNVGEVMGKSVYLPYYFLGQKRFIRKMIRKKYIEDAKELRKAYGESTIDSLVKICKNQIEANIDVEKILLQVT